MKKIYLVLLAGLVFTNPCLAFTEKVKLKIGKVKASFKKGASNSNFIVSKSGDLMNIAFGYGKIVISRNPKSTQIISSLTFEVPEEDFESGTTYDLVPPANELNEDGYNLNAIITASKTVGSKGWSVSTLAEGVENPRAFGKLKVISYDPATGELKAKLSAYFSSSSSGKPGKTKVSSKNIPYIAAFTAILD